MLFQEHVNPVSEMLLCESIRVLQVRSYNKLSSANIVQVNTLSDETGSISGNKLIWSDKAWRRLLGRSTDNLVETSQEDMKYIDSALLYCRATFLMGWNPDIGRLVVCDIHL